MSVDLLSQLVLVFEGGWWVTYEDELGALPEEGAAGVDHGGRPRGLHQPGQGSREEGRTRLLGLLSLKKV